MPSKFNRLIEEPLAHVIGLKHRASAVETTP